MVDVEVRECENTENERLSGNCNAHGLISTSLFCVYLWVLHSKSSNCEYFDFEAASTALLPF